MFVYSKSARFLERIYRFNSKGRCTLVAAVEGYCMKCKAKKVIKSPKEVTAKNGRPMIKGVCPDCGTTICKIGSIKKAK
jgi:hypothetical protein